MGTIATTVALLLLMALLFADSAIVGTQHPKQIPLGSSLHPTTLPTSWPSPSGLFAFGFYQEGSGIAIGIWLVGRNNKHTVVWTANRDDPPLTSNAKLQLTMEGMLAVPTQQGQEKLIVNANATASFASMLDSGNFVLYNNNSKAIWQSFDYPTDTMLGDQTLAFGGQLISSSSETSHSIGRFTLEMQHDGNLVSYPVYVDTEINAYWASGTNGHKCHLFLNKTGSLLFRNDSDLEPIQYLYDSNLVGNINKKKAIYRATLDVDGVFRLYVHDGNDTSSTTILQSWPDNQCIVKGFCGFNSYCTFDDQNPYCNCLPGFDFIDLNQKTLGCKRNFSEAKCDERYNSALYNMVSMPNLVWGDTPYFQVQMSQEEECSFSCLADCNCWAALYQNNLCMMQEPPLKYVRRTVQSDASSLAFLKVGNLKLNEIHPLVPEVDQPQPPPIKSTNNKSIVQIIFVILSCTLLLCLTIGISCHFMYKIRVLKYKRLLEIGDLGLNEEVALRRFSYNELKKATIGFKDELGKGSFGAVYKGVLYKGRSRRLIAVKRLEKLVEEGEREFQAEMRAIGKTHHRNLVRLLGFCADGPKRLLVYEYMSNGSLGNLLFGDVTSPDWE